MPVTNITEFKFSKPITVSPLGAQKKDISEASLEEWCLRFAIHSDQRFQHKSMK